MSEPREATEELDYRPPRISEEAERLIDALFAAEGEEVTDAMLNLHRFIERLEKNARRRAATTTTNKG